MDMSTSELFRWILIIALVAFFIYRNAGFVKKAKAQKAKKQTRKQIEELRTQRKEQRMQQLMEAKRKHEQAQKRTAEILVRSTVEAGLRSGTAEVAGMTLHYIDSGGDPAAMATAPRILLLHGFAADKETWLPLAGRLAAEGFRVVAPDLPGFGQNQKNPKLQYDVMSQAKRIRAFAKAIDFTPCHVVGASLGAMIAGAYAYGAVDEIQSLTLIEPMGVRVPYQSELDEWLAQDRNPLMIANPAAYDNLLGFLCATPPDIPDELKTYRAEQLVKNRELYQRMWLVTRGGDRANLLDMVLPEVKQRTLVILGKESKIVHSATGEAIHHMMPPARTVSLDGCGHMPMLEKPDDVTAHLVMFLSSVPAA